MHDWRVGTTPTSHGLARPIVARFAATLIFVALTASCTSTPAERTTHSIKPTASLSPQASSLPVQVSDYASFAAALEGDGFVVSRGERTGLPARRDIHGQQVFIDGVPVSVFELPTEKALRKFRSSTSTEGDEIPAEGGGSVIIQWERPHFFAAGKLLVLYFGDKRGTLATLERLLGPQFAGPR